MKFIFKLNKFNFKRTTKMTTIDIPKRLFTLMIRATEIKWEQLLEEAKKQNSTDEGRKEYMDKDFYDDTFYTLTFGDFEFTLDYDIISTHDDTCFDDEGNSNQDERLLLSDTCNCDKDESYSIGLRYKDKGLFYKVINETSLEAALKIVGGIKATYEICMCGETASKDGWCVGCYIHRYTRTEEEGGVCSCCYENEGRWVRLECKHEIHLSCFHKIEFDVKKGRKCPLCRHQSNKYKVDCYDC
jgi:hypothetical protein